MKSNKEKNLSHLKLLESLIMEMENKQVQDPEYLIRNIQLIDKIISMFQNFKNSLIEKLSTS